MRVRLSRSKPVPRGRRDGRAEAHGRGAPAPAPPPPPAPSRERRGGASQDRALYVCRCGSAFAADVTASVSCPHCGESQAW
jgi:hypothetical protein